MIQALAQPADFKTSEGLAPPRPNLGPEPMDADGSPALMIALLLGGFIILAALLALRRRWTVHQMAETAKWTAEGSAEARLLALRERARALLAARLGPALRARTTEELADDAHLAEALGPEKLTQLIALLRAGDRLLFDGDSPMEPLGVPMSELAAWSDLLGAIARSRLGSGDNKNS